MSLREAQARLSVAVGAPASMADLEPRAARALTLAQLVGAPVGPALAAAAAAADDDRARQRALEVATAQAKLVQRGLALLPVVLVPGFDLLVGLPLLDFYVTSAGMVVGALGLGLAAAGAGVATVLVQRVPSRGRGDPVAPCDEVADLLAAALRAGLPAAGAARAVATVLPEVADHLRFGALALEHDRVVPDGTVVSEALTLLRVAEVLGAPASDELVALARDQRAREQARVAARAERLAAQLTVPAVLLLLPATVLLVGAPIVAAGLGAT